jgi:DNA-binding CsgD family transcriptional regulator
MSITDPTRRELEVLALVEKGATTSEIASKLYISTRTVESHISSLLSKSGCKSRLEMLRHFAQIGLIDPIGSTDPVLSNKFYTDYLKSLEAALLDLKNRVVAIESRQTRTSDYLKTIADLLKI